MKEKITKILTTILFIIFICSLSYIVYKQYENKIEENRIEELKQSIVVENPGIVDIVEEQLEKETPVIETEDFKTETQKEEQTILPEYEELYNDNTDLIGWIKIEDTPIDYPVMQTFDDPTYYINRNWDKNESAYGLPLMDARCTLESENIIIYSHRMKNGTMFGSLKKYNEENFFRDHQIIKFDTIYEKNNEYQIIAVLLSQVFYVDDTDEVSNEAPNGEFAFYNYIELDSKEIFQEYINQVKERSLYETGITAEYGDSLITLCTCSYHVKDGRLLVVAKKIQ